MQAFGFRLLVLPCLLSLFCVWVAAIWAALGHSFFSFAGAFQHRHHVKRPAGNLPRFARVFSQITLNVGLRFGDCLSSTPLLLFSKSGHLRLLLKQAQRVAVAEEIHFIFAKQGRPAGTALGAAGERLRCQRVMRQHQIHGHHVTVWSLPEIRRAGISGQDLLLWVPVGLAFHPGVAERGSRGFFHGFKANGCHVGVNLWLCDHHLVSSSIHR